VHCPLTLDGLLFLRLFYTIDKLTELIEQTVEEKLIKLFGDPDERLDWREEIIACLKRSTALERKAVKGIPAKEVAKKRGLE